MEGIIIILGSPNDEEGNLSDTAIGRLNKGLQEYRCHPDYKILCTGGFGEHFNTTDKPHACYAVNYLLQKGLLETDILEIVESQNTLEDALLSKPIIEKYNVTSLIIVSSDFHMKRVKYIFEKVYKGYQLTFSEAETDYDEEQYEILRNHEKKELEKLKKKGIPSF